MKKCAIISCYIVNEYRRKLVQSLVDTFCKHDIDVILVSSSHIPKLNNIKNYITCENVCTTHYINSGYTYFGINLNGTECQFWKGKKDPNQFYENYFIKMYQIVLSYVKNLGYTYTYFIDQDMILNDNSISEITNPNLDINKAYFYKWTNWYSPIDAPEYQVTFFHGNIKVLQNLFSDEKLEELSNYCKTTIMGVEASVYFLAKDNTDIISFVKDPNEMFSGVNLFSSANVAEVYFDHKNKKYIFLHSKSDISESSMFSAELYENEQLIYQNTISHKYVWNIVNLKPSTRYTIKYYDREISSETLYTTTNIYTDIDNPSTSNYIVC